jgi:hypothetical protein
MATRVKWALWNGQADKTLRRRAGELISTGWVESAINEIIAKRMAKSRQMRWNRAYRRPER